jgi:hypothetical protein
LAADKKADSTAHSKPARVRSIRRLPAVAAGAPVITAAVAVVGVAGIATGAWAISSQTATHATGNITAPARTASSATPKRAVSSASPTYTPKHASSAAPKKTTSSAAPKHAAPAPKASPAKKSSPSAKSKATLDAAKTVWFTVESGDSLSSISGQVYGNANDWPVLYYANQSKIASPNDISVGQVLKVPALPATIPAAPAMASTSTSSSASSGSSAAASTATSSASQSSSSVNASDYSGFQQCVIERESGGNSQVMNSSGHYGLYQFSESTWVAYGGSAADFGNASVAEQNQVFENAMAAGGESNWAPYDGC